MRLISTVAAVLALATSAVAQIGDEKTAGFNSITAPAENEEVPVGKTFTIKWAVGTVKPTGKVKIVLNGGKDAGHLEAKGTIASKY